MATFAEINGKAKGIRSRSQRAKDAAGPIPTMSAPIPTSSAPKPVMAGQIQEWLTNRYGTLISGGDGSPIETLFKAAVSILAHICRVEGDDTPKALGGQEQIGPYRVDFTITAFGKTVIVEVDGHDFHEKTKEQAQRDKARDRYLIKHGHTVIHFTGSEVWANPFACAQEAFDVCKALSGEVE